MGKRVEVMIVGHDFAGSWVDGWKCKCGAAVTGPEEAPVFRGDAQCRAKREDKKKGVRYLSAESKVLIDKAWDEVLRLRALEVSGLAEGAAQAAIDAGFKPGEDPPDDWIIEHTKNKSMGEY